MRLHDDAGVQIGEHIGTLFFTAAESGTFFASAATSFPAWTGDYRLATRQIDLSADLAGDSSSTTALLVGSEVANSIEAPGDEDWFRVELAPGALYRLDLLHDDRAGSPLPGPVVRLFDAGGSLLVEQSDTLFFTAPAAGTYFASAGGYSEHVGDYRLTANTVDLAFDVLGDINSTAMLPMGGEVVGAVEFPADEDWFRVDLAAGEIYRFLIIRFTHPR